MITKWKWLVLLLFVAGCNQSSNVADSTAPEPGDEAPKPVVSSSSEEAISEPVAPSAPAETSGPGLSVGTKAPDFTLKNQAGEDISLSSLLDDTQYVALVFYRSADW